MTVLHQLFGRPSDIDTVRAFGNTIVSGADNDGCRRLYQRLLMDLLFEKRTIVMVDGALTEDRLRGNERFVRPHMICRNSYSFGLTGCDDAIDIMSAFSSNEDKVEFIVGLIASIPEATESLKVTARRYYAYVVDLLDEKGRTFKLKDLTAIDVDYALELLEASGLPDVEKRRRERFFRDTTTYSSYMRMDSILSSLESIGILDLYSGDLRFEDMFIDGNVVMLSGMIHDEFSRKEVLFNTFFNEMIKYLIKNRGTGRIAFIIKNADFISGDIINGALLCNEAYGYATYMFVNDVSKCVEKNGVQMLDNTKTFLVFCQGSEENAAFWSNFFGSRESQERSYSYNRKKSVNPLASLHDGGGVVASPRKYNSSSVSYQKVHKPIYLTEVFRELMPDEVMIYLRKPLVRRKTRIG